MYYTLNWMLKLNRFSYCNAVLSHFCWHVRQSKRDFFVKIAMWLTHALTEPVQGHDSHRQPPQTQTNTPIHDWCWMALERRRKKDERRKKKKVYIIYACIACMLSYKMAVKTTGRREQKQKPEKPGCVQRTGILWEKKGEKGKSDTRTSNVVSHHRTNRARPCLTSEIGRDQVLSRWYGRFWHDTGTFASIYPVLENAWWEFPEFCLL